MRHRWILIAAILVVIVAVVIWLQRDDFPVFILGLASLVYLAGAITLILAGWLMSGVIWRLLPRRATSALRRRRAYFQRVVILTFLGFVAVAWFVNNRWLPTRTDPAALTADIGLLCVAALVAWGILGRRRAPMIAALPFIVAVVIAAAMDDPVPAERDPNKGDAFGTLPYLTYVPTKEGSDEKNGVTINDDRAFPGINLYCTRVASDAYLVDMSGTVLHTWRADIIEDDWWNLVELMPNGDLMAIVVGKGGDRGRMLVLFDWESNVKWQRHVSAHHDFAAGEGGEVYVLTTDKRVYSVYGVPMPVLNEGITLISPDGDVTKTISFLEVLKDHIPLNRFTAIYSWLLRPSTVKRLMKSRGTGRDYLKHGSLDVFHSNTVEVIPRDFGGPFKKGNLLFCARNLDLIGVLDPDHEKVLWTWGPGELDRPHHPAFTDDGTILVFDNGSHRGFTRIVELNPLTEEIVWEYVGDPPESFYSHTRGSNQRMPNGNTLITNSDSGQVFEVTADGEMVWEFWVPSPRVEEKKRAAIYRLQRITNPDAYPCLRDFVKASDDR